ncbi:6023_t:CDS:2 [Cetraspora pellucida]|uniref:6023_t:CDS:1 n=1 Tax=Cetraspora pellucida TaxID=1433469 RepID=A0A9N9NPS4_9GLOM|nr:6023_t:CDS:2 [Cetraspora pellucida]
MQIINFFKQQKCLIDNLVKIFDIKKEKIYKPSKLLYHIRNKKDEKIIQKAFNRTFQDPSNLLERFIQFINKCLNEYNTSDSYYYTLYTTLIQASSVEKSKLLINVAVEIMSVYCCLQKSESSGYPHRLDIAKMLIKEFNNKQNTKTNYLAYIFACFQKMQDFRNFWKDVENRMKNIKVQLMTCFTDKGPVKYLFAFDEASTLAGNKDGSKNSRKFLLFYYIQCALTLLPKETGIFAVFTDTYSNISNFSPAYYLNPSKRVAEEKFKLFTLFYLLDTIDMNVNLKEIKTLKERPLWGALLMPSSDAKGIESERIVKLAIDKLIGRKYFGVWREEVQIKILNTLAILEFHLCIEIVLQSVYAPDLIANNMCLCISVLENCKYVVILMPTEPVLVEASTRIINKLSKALKKNIIEADYYRELTVRLLLLNT